MRQIVLVLHYLKAKRVIHRDMKLGNILLGQSLEVKVIDFGLAYVIKEFDEKLLEFCGTYIAPEMIEDPRNENKQGYSFEVDMWALGVMMYIMLIGKSPFRAKNKKALLKKIKNV